MVVSVGLFTQQYGLFEESAPLFIEAAYGLFTIVPLFTGIALSAHRITAASDNRIDATGNQRITAGI